MNGAGPKKQNGPKVISPQSPEASEYRELAIISGALGSASELAEARRQWEALVFRKGRKVASRLADAGMAPPARPSVADGASELTVEHAYYATLGQAFMVALYKNARGVTRVWWDSEGRQQRIPQRSPHTREGLGDVVREYNRILGAEERNAKVPDRFPSLDEPIAVDEAGVELTLGDILADRTAPSPETLLEEDERVKGFLKRLNDNEKQTLERILSGDPVRDEADKKSRYRLRKKLRGLGVDAEFA
jgi:hypothetical protein